MKKRSLMVLPLAAAFALAGCSSSEDGGSTDTAPEGTQSEQSTQTEETQQTEAASGDTLDGAQVKAVVEALIGDAENAQVLDNDTLKAQAGQSAQLMESIQIEPAECKSILSETSLTDAGESIQAAGIIPSAQDSTTFQVISLAPNELSKVNELLEMDGFQGCENLVQDVGGQKAELTMSIIDSPQVDAEKVLAIQTETSSEATAGMTTTAISLQALNGNNFVSATYTALVSSADEAFDIEQKLGDLASEVDRAFAEIEKIN